MFFSNYAINEGIIPPSIGRPIKNSCSLSQCKTGGSLNWKRDSCQIPLYREDRLGSLQPLPEQDGKNHNLVQHVHKEDMEDILASRSNNHYNDDLFYYKNRSMSADMQNKISNHDVRSNSFGEAQNDIYHNGESLLGNCMAEFDPDILETKEQTIKSFSEYELVEEKALYQEQPFNATNLQDNETIDSDKNKIQDLQRSKGQSRKWRQLLTGK